MAADPEDGSVVVPSVLDPQQFQLTFVRPDGAVETQTVNLPNGALWYPFRAVPNGQGGLLVQVRRLLWPELETHHIDALVVGVDAGGTVTGSTPLADDWGEIVVGERGQVLVTSEVEYWTEPGSGGVAKRHVGFLQQITPEGNPAAFPQFFPPSGPCGWIWDGIRQEWYDNGACDQAVISVTSIAARGSDTIVTLSDGRVFGPGALSQLHLSYLVPAADGTYLGAGMPPGGPAGPAAARGGRRRGWCPHELRRPVRGTRVAVHAVVCGRQSGRRLCREPTIHQRRGRLPKRVGSRPWSPGGPAVAVRASIREEHSPQGNAGCLPRVCRDLQ